MHECFYAYAKNKKRVALYFMWMTVFPEKIAQQHCAAFLPEPRALPTTLQILGRFQARVQDARSFAE